MVLRGRRGPSRGWVGEGGMERSVQAFGRVEPSRPQMRTDGAPGFRAFMVFVFHIFPRFI